MGITSHVDIELNCARNGIQSITPFLAKEYTDDTRDKCGRHGFRPLLDVQAKAGDKPCAEKSDDLNHSVVDSNWVCESTSMLAGLRAAGYAIAKNPNG